MAVQRVKRVRKKATDGGDSPGNGEVTDPGNSGRDSRREQTPVNDSPVADGDAIVTAEDLEEYKSNKDSLSIFTEPATKGQTLMSIFGDLDVTDLPDDPFYTAPNTYKCVCVEAKIVEKDGKRAFTISWQIDEPESEFNKNRISEYYQLPDPGITDLNELDSDQRRSLKFLKARLIKGFDFTNEEANAANPSECIGKTAYVTTVVKDDTKGGTDKKFTNVQDAISERLYKEQNDSVTASMGGL